MRIKPPENKTFCMAAWTHTYLSPLSERRLCCGSREQSSFVKQYIDRSEKHGVKYSPVSLSEHWNSEHMKSVRRRMMAGETLPECEICNDNILSLTNYRSWFTKDLFPHLIDEAFAKTDDDGRTEMKPISFDYRFNNSCNFKCRMCGEQFSSSWEIENQKAGYHDYVRDPWLEPTVRKQIQDFQDTVVEEEFAEAVRSGRVREIYWVGGEPLVWQQHWKYMKEIVELGYASEVYARYNTNLSIIEKNGVKLFEDLLPHVKGYMISASIDGAGAIGEFIRSGLKWNKWLENFERGVFAARQRGNAMVMMDITLTLPGLFSVVELFEQALRLDVRTETKLIYAFDPFVLLSPLALPKDVLVDLVNGILQKIEHRATDKQMPLINTLRHLRDRQTFAEAFPDTYKEKFFEGRHYLLEIGKRRGDGEGKKLSFEKIYQAHPGVLSWWNQVKAEENV